MVLSNLIEEGSKRSAEDRERARTLSDTVVNFIKTFEER